jgi:hypothetical protein
MPVSPSLRPESRSREQAHADAPAREREASVATAAAGQEPHASATRRVAGSLLLLACAGTLAARLISAAWLDDMPHVMDEITYDLQAQMLAIGRISGPEVQPIAAFHQWFVEDRGQRYGIFPPGWPAALALGHRVGLARWVNPVLHGLTVFLIGWLGFRVRDAALGRLGALLYALCPQALLLAGSVMSNTLAACLAVLALGWTITLLGGANVASERRAEALRAIGAGFALGWLGAARPLCAVVIGGCCAGCMLVCVQQGKARCAHAWAVPALLVPLALLLLYNRALLGSALHFPQNHFFDTHAPPTSGPIFRYAPGCNALGFGPSHGCELTAGTQGHTLTKAALHTLHNLRAWLALAAGGGFLAIAAVLSLASRATRRLGLWLLAPLLLIIAAYATYWGIGTCYGARFYQVALPFSTLAAALGLLELAARSRARARLAWGMGIAAAVVSIIAGARAHAEVSNGYWGTDARFLQLRDHYHGPDAVVLVAFREESAAGVPNNLTGTGVWRWPNGIRILSAQAANAPLLDGPLVFGRYHPALISAVRRSFPRRKLFVYIMAQNPRDDALMPLERFRLNTPANLPPPADNFSGVVLRGATSRSIDARQRSAPRRSNTDHAP